MLLSGFTFIRNARKYDFPVIECIESMLPIVDELVVNVGKSEDGTEELIASIKSPKIKVVSSVWDDTKTERGLVLSEQTNIALDACQGRWCLYLQADEALYESEHEKIRREIEMVDSQRESVLDKRIDALRFRYLHFYGGYTMVQRPWNWYPTEIRVVRKAAGPRSYGDAQTFRDSGNNELRAKLIDAHVYHYGHAREPGVMAKKNEYFHRFWHGDNHGKNEADAYRREFKNLTWFWGEHPAPYRARVEAGRGWSTKPEHVVKPDFKRIVLYSDQKTLDLAHELKALVESRMPPGTQVAVVSDTLAWMKSFLQTLVRRQQSAFVDLHAEQRPPLEFLYWVLDAVSAFRWRVAHAPTGKLSPFRARFYNAVNWGTHERASEGFVVPPAAHAKQLARWLGIET